MKNPVSKSQAKKLYLIALIYTYNELNETATAINILCSYIKVF